MKERREYVGGKREREISRKGKREEIYSSLVEQPTNKCTRHTHWLANCTSYLEHPCQLWYGKPTEVWSNSLSSFDVNYFLISSITNRIVYVNAEVNFGRFMGTDNVLIVVPIPFD